MAGRSEGGLRSRAVRNALKRGIDGPTALVVLVVLAPIMVVIALLIVIESPGPVFYRAERVGYRGRRLMMLKFRKMHPGATGCALTLAGDPRLTRVGRVLNRTRLDELPQFWHVVRGEMSIVGPRPEDPRFVARYERDYAEILGVRPGLTGWTQIAFAREGTLLDVGDPVEHYVQRILPQKIRLDRMYAASPTLARDRRILWSTILVTVAHRAVAVDRATGTMTPRRRPQLTEGAGDAGRGRSWRMHRRRSPAVRQGQGRRSRPRIRAPLSDRPVAGRLAERAVVQCIVQRDDPPNVVGTDPGAASLPSRTSIVGMVEQPLDRPGGSFDVADLHEISDSTGEQLRDATDPRPDNRRGEREGLENATGKTLPVRQQEGRS
jgi:lipopolysaccharide/colanic/teichoic acid biosynthesis glycosyltransferase